MNNPSQKKKPSVWMNLFLCFMIVSAIFAATKYWPEHKIASIIMLLAASLWLERLTRWVVP